jgi:hypothetical protein
MVYPTEDGIIPTWGWEGFRAAADDIRYVTTLAELLEANEGSQAARQKAQRFLERMDPDKDLEAQRRSCAKHIMALTSA